MNAGIAPGLTYDTAVYGFSLQEQRDLRRGVVAANGLAKHGVSHYKAAILCDKVTPRATIAPLLQWDKEVWLNMVNKIGEHRGLVLSELGTAWRTSTEHSRYSKVRGPVGAIRGLMVQLGWAWAAPFVVFDELGIKHIITRVSPALLRKHLLRAYENWLLNMVAKNKTFRNENITMYPLQKVLRIGGLSDMQAAVLRCWAVGAFWTPARKHAYGLEDCAKCPLCGAAVCDMEHILKDCSALDNHRDHDVKQCFREIQRDPQVQALASEGMMTHPEAAMPEPADTLSMTYWSIDGDIDRKADSFCGKIFLDGSCASTAWGMVKRASWSAVALTEERVVSAYLRGPVWKELPQTSPVAEFVAFAAAAEIAGVGSQCFVDYRTVERAYANPRAALSDKVVIAGIFRDAAIDKGYKNIASVTWIKAHRKEKRPRMMKKKY